MACGAPVLASPVGMSREIVQPGVQSEPATERAEWAQAPRMLSILQTATRGRNA